ncbi:hypothetical protein V6O07_03785 [Arthrospira platensis SPKY2]
MTNLELSRLSLNELKALNTRVVEMIKTKMTLESQINKDNLRIGGTCIYTGVSSKLIGKRFEIQNLNRTNAVCKCLVTGQLWNIKMANLKTI